jgi:hypothetical protein
MQSVNQQILKAHLMGWAEKILRSAHKDFALNPNAVNWNNLMRAMFVYQQSEFAVRSYSIDHAKLVDALDADQADWADVVCMATVGQTLRDAVPTAEFVNIETV